MGRAPRGAGGVAARAQTTRQAPCFTDDVLPMTHSSPPPAHTALGLWSLSLAYFTMGTSSIAVVGLVHPIAAVLGVSKPDVAVLITVFAITFALAAPLLQVAAGSLPRRTLLLCGLVVLGTGCLLSALAPTYAGVVAARVLMALGAAAVGPVASGLGAGLVDVKICAINDVWSGLKFVRRVKDR